MNPTPMLDFRMALTLLGLLLVVALFLVGGLVGVSVGDARALRRSGKNGALLILATAAPRRHLMFGWLALDYLWGVVYRIVYGAPAPAYVRIVIVLIAVGVILGYGVCETMDRWKLRFYFRNQK